MDDNGDMRDYMRRLLASNYEVEAVADGEAALASIDRQLPDLVLADIMMPRLVIWRGLRSDPSTRTLPIILVSARAGEEAKAEGLGAGADDYLEKPFAARELLAKVAASITAAGLRRETERLLRRNQGWLAGQRGAFQAAVNGAPLEEALGILVRTATDQMAGNARCAFYMANREGTELRHVVGMPNPDARDVEGFRIGLDSPACGLAVATGEPVFTHDVIEEPRWAAWGVASRKVRLPRLLVVSSRDFGGHARRFLCSVFQRATVPDTGGSRNLFARAHPYGFDYHVPESGGRGTRPDRSRAARERGAAAGSRRVGASRPIMVGTPQTNELQWDDAVRAMCGLPGGAPVGYATWRSGVHPDDLPRVEAAIARCVNPSSDGLYNVEYRVNGRDGVERWIATRGRANFEDGMAISFYGVALDVTAQKRSKGHWSVASKPERATWRRRLRFARSDRATGSC